MAFSNQGAFTPPSSQVAPGPCAHCATVVPSDSTVGFGTTNALSRYIYVGKGGDLTVLLAGDKGGSVTLVGVLTGTMLALCAQQVLATGTTADDIVALW